MRKGIAVLAIALIGMLVAVVVEGVVLVNFVFRIELSIRAAREGEIVKKINEVEFVKRGLDKTLTYSFHQASYFIASRGGYSDFDNIPSYNCIPYWRNYTTINYPNNFKENLENAILKTFNNYVNELENLIVIPNYERAIIEKESIEIKKCEGSAKLCIYFGTAEGCKSQKGCYWIWAWDMYICTGVPTPCSDISYEDCPLQGGCYQVREEYIEGIRVNISASNNLKISGDFYEISDQSNFSRNFSAEIFELFSIGKEKFVNEDRIGDTVADAINLYDCDDSKTDIISSINSKISSLQASLNSQYSTENIGFTLSADSIQFDPSCNSTVAVRVLVKMKDTKNKYPVYDDALKTTMLRNIQLKFYVLSGNYVIQPITNTCG